MKKNASYETHRPPVREVVQLQDKAKPTDVRFKLSETISRSNDDKTNTSTSNTNLRTNSAKCIGLVVVLFLLASAMITTIALSVYTRVDSNQSMDNLIEEIQELKMQLNKTKEDLTRLRTDSLRLHNSFDTKINATTTQLSSLLSSVSTLNTTDNDFMTELNTLGSSVNSLNVADNLFDTQLNSLQSSINSRLNSLESSVSSLNTANGATTTQLNSLQSSVGSLTSQVNSPVNLYQKCIQETQSCTVTSGSAYWKHCTTSSLPVNESVSCQLCYYNCCYVMIYICLVQGYYTLSMTCKYDPPTGWLDTSTLRQSGSNVKCLCWITSTISSPGEHASVNFPTFTCTLVITRCSTSQNIV